MTKLKLKDLSMGDILYSKPLKEIKKMECYKNTLNFGDTIILVSPYKTYTDENELCIRKELLGKNYIYVSSPVGCSGEAILVVEKKLKSKRFIFPISIFKKTKDRIIDIRKFPESMRFHELNNIHPEYNRIALERKLCDSLNKHQFHKELIKNRLIPFLYGKKLSYKKIVSQLINNFNMFGSIECRNCFYRLSTDLFEHLAYTRVNKLFLKCPMCEARHYTSIVPNLTNDSFNLFVLVLA